MFEFEYPFILALLLLFIFGAYTLKPREDALLISGPWGQTQMSKSYLFILKWLGIVFLLLALSSPVSKKEFFPDHAPAHAIMLALDLSTSMKHPMKGGYKIDIAKNLASEFVQKRKDDHIGLVGFADFAYLASPLSYDVKALRQVIERIGLGEATALRDGVFMAMRMLKNSKAKEKILIVLTDGEDTASQMPPNILYKMIKEQHVKIYSIGVGYGMGYNKSFLEYISTISGGRFYHASSADALKKVYAQIDSLEKTDLQRQHYVKTHYYYQYPLFLSFLFFVAFLYFKIRRGK